MLRSEFCIWVPSLPCYRRSYVVYSCPTMDQGPSHDRRVLGPQVCMSDPLKFPFSSPPTLFLTSSLAHANNRPILHSSLSSTKHHIYKTTIRAETSYPDDGLSSDTALDPRARRSALAPV